MIATGTLSDVSTKGREAPSDSVVGRRVGRFEILSLLGSGGMSRVYLSRLDGFRGFEKLLALKILRRSLSANPQFVEMFLHEARVVAHLQHPNVVQVLELGQWQGRYFMAMEYLQGVPLGKVFEKVEDGERPLLEPRVACAMIMQACEGLQLVHTATDHDNKPLSLVHLDISPQNLFVTTSGTIKLIDFGIARSSSLAPAVAPSPFRGRYAYASPEQLDGSVPDRRSDVFSLGTVLWEMLAGRRLFLGATPLESFYRVSTAPIPLLSTIRPDLPADLERVVMKALSRDPAQRYQTALAFYRDLASVSGHIGRPVSQHEISRLLHSWFTADEFSSRNPTSQSATPAPQAA